jgi:hypothetical protein
LVLNTWKSLFQSDFEAENPQPFYQHFQGSEAETIATFLPLVCTVKKLHNTKTKPVTTNTTFSTNPNYSKRFCPSCGKDINNQSKRTVFCSEKVYGKAAKKCRNKSSNKRRDHKRKIISAMKRNIYLVITYLDKASNAYSDILHPSEVFISKEWVDKIQTIKTISANNNTNKSGKNKCNKYHKESMRQQLG